MKLLLFIFTFILVNESIATCYVFVFGGSYHPERKKIDKTIKNKSDEIIKDATKMGCKTVEPVYNSDPMTYYQQIKLLLADIKTNDKINIAFTDHGAGETIPTGGSENIKFENLLTEVDKVLKTKKVSNVQLTYTSHICWGGVLHDGLNSFMKNNKTPSFLGCGATSVDNKQLSNGYTNYSELKRRENEYISAGWTDWSSNTQPTISSFDKSARKHDFVNSTRGAGTSSFHYLLKELGYEPYGTKKTPNIFRDFLTNPTKGYRINEMISYFNDHTVEIPEESEVSCQISMVDSFQFIKDLIPYLDPNDPTLQKDIESILKIKSKFANSYGVFLKEKVLHEDEIESDSSLISMNWEIDEEKLSNYCEDFKKQYDELKLAILGVDPAKKSSAINNWNIFVNEFKSKFGDGCQSNSTGLGCYPWDQFKYISEALGPQKLRFDDVFKKSPLFNGSNDSHALKLSFEMNIQNHWDNYLKTVKAPYGRVSTKLQDDFQKKLEIELQSKDPTNTKYQELKKCENSSVI